MDDEYGLVKADRMARSLSPQLARTQRLLAAHGLVEVRIGPHLLTTAAKTAGEGHDNGIDDNRIDGNSALREAESGGEFGWTELVPTSSAPEMALFSFCFS